ncbi:MAG: cell envelope biogenesis protein OmpA [Bacteroidota bacterium]
MKQSGINALKDLLFEEEREKYQQLHAVIKEIEERMDEDLDLQELPQAQVELLLERMMEFMPEKLGPTITKTLKVQIRESQDDVVQALFPIIGQMIKRYIQQEIATLSEKLDRQFDDALSIDRLMLRIKAWITGTKYSELLLAETNRSTVQEIFIIEEQSGILMASYSRQGLLDQDMVAGMLTAIKTFVNEAFSSEQQTLETISYDQFTIYVQSFQRFYLAAVLSGTMDHEFKQKLDDTILKFVRDGYLNSPNVDQATLTQKIDQYFQRI